MANKFWKGGGSSTNWSATGPTNWASSSGGSNNVAIPVASVDNVVFDSLSAGNCVIDIDINPINMTFTSYTGTLDNATNNKAVTIAGFLTGTGATATLNMGSGIWTLSSGAQTTIWTSAGFTALNAGTSTITLTGTRATTTNMVLGAFTYYNLTIGTGLAIPVALTGPGATISNNFTVTAPCSIQIVSGNTINITPAVNFAGTVSNPIYIASNAAAAQGTLSFAAACTGSGVAMRQIAVTGAGSLKIVNGLDLGGNTGSTINTPVSGIIGG